MVKRQKVFLDIVIDNIPSGRMVFVLYNDLLPTMCKNFYHLCVGDMGLGKETNQTLHYQDCLFHRVVKGLIVQSGDFTHNSGVGGESIFGGMFRNEDHLKDSAMKRHSQAGTLSMVNSGMDTYGSQFFVTLNRVVSLDKKHIVIGYLKSGMDVLRQIESVPTDRNDKPMGEVRIERCGDFDSLCALEGELIEKESQAVENDIEKIKTEMCQIITPPNNSGANNQNDAVGPDLSKMTDKEKKFHELKLKFRSSAIDTKREVTREYARSDKKKETVNNSQNNRKRNYALTANDALKIYEKRKEKENLQNNDNCDDRAFTAYIRKVEKLESLGTIQSETDLADMNDLDVVKNVSNDKKKVEELANEISQMQEKRRKFSRRRKFNEERDISFINRRNEAFNAKVARAFDKYTSEIKGNLERGTAL